MKMKTEVGIIAIIAFIVTLFKEGGAIQCYQCDSNEDNSCPADRWFDQSMNALVDCGGFEAHVPGTFCVKIYQESPGWNGWVKITRRCGSRTDTGVAWGCRYWYEDNGVFKETCYCDNFDGCNGSSRIPYSFITTILSVISATIFIRWLR
ncbi:UPAR/Ly6 domain-containing protein crok-like [Tubulanus polymorphus]|uniref:UPAR/Ly6 domain-containing protein crok-like n=1 Tax=Tubulanus polymorphus TaxID=672921 RepID=UPI003DA2E885